MTTTNYINPNTIKRDFTNSNPLTNSILYSPIGVLIIKVDDRKIIYCNSAFENQFELGGIDLIGHEIEKVLSLNTSFKRISEVLSHPNENWQTITFNFNNTRSSGELDFYYMQIVIDRQEFNQSDTHIYCYYINNTQQETIKVELEKALKADTLKSEYIANISHEIRTPLNAITGFSELLSETDLPEEKKQYTEIIKANNNQLLDIINDVLDYSKLESKKINLIFEKTNIGYIISLVKDSYSLLLNSEVQFIIENNAPNTPITTDRRRVVQIISNLLSNGFKFTEKGYVKLSYSVEDADIVFHVTDTGCGISTQNCQILFERFARFNERKKGTGLGLAICKLLVEQLGGKIGVTSIEGLGSDFWFSLPLSAEVPTKGMNITKPHTQIKQDPLISINYKPDETSYADKKTILIAEDQMDNFELLNEILKKEFRIIHAEDGEKAVSLYLSTKPDLLLMDLKMPLLCGAEVIKEIRRKSSTVPIIILTALAFSDEISKAITLGANDYLLKPFTRKDIISIIKKHLPDF